MEIWVTAELARQDDTAPVWSKDGIRGFGVYASDADETEGQRLAIEKITEDIINLTIRSW
ncbi:MAG: hypothetical protein GF341_04090 [candidate division Zixibacteria bacterium]|nr:hypothetical protein [candidate division Zixibacteria bacterium]